MKRTPFTRLAFVTVLAVSLPIAACSFATGSTGGNSSESSSSSSQESILSTPNVSYAGFLDELGLSIYMQGSHKLTLDDGQMIILQSTDENLNLDVYIGKHVEAHGSVQATVEGGGTIMGVTEIIVLDEMSSSPTPTSSSAMEQSSSLSSSASGKMCGGIAGIACDNEQVCVDDPSDTCDPLTGGADCSGICVVEIKSSVKTSSQESNPSSSQKTVSSFSSSSKSVTPSSSSSVSSSSSSVSSMSKQMEEQIVAMSKQSYDQSNFWTQKYCTSHFGFCIPVHKNWYFKSFGATTTNMWHVEFGQNEIDELGQGAIVLNLVAGTSASMSAQDGGVKAKGSDVIGYKDTADGKHFELIADARLRAAVEYMLSEITPYELAQ